MPKLVRLLSVLAFAQAACGRVITPPDASGARCQDGSELLRNGGFEDMTTGWISDPDHSYFCSTAVITPPHGMWSGCLGVTSAAVETLTQEVRLPDGAKTVTLIGAICIATMETGTLDHDVLSLDLLDGGTVIARLGTFSNRNGGSTCTFKPLQASATLVSNPGAATLSLQASQDGANVTTFYLDDLSLTVGCAP